MGGRRRYGRYGRGGTTTGWTVSSDARWGRRSVARSWRRYKESWLLDVSGGGSPRPICRNGEFSDDRVTGGRGEARAGRAGLPALWVSAFRGYTHGEAAGGTYSPAANVPALRVSVCDIRGDCRSTTRSNDCVS